jgi:sec-independent protein translocase protein TatC
MSSLNPTEAFMLSMKLAFFAGTVLAFPLLLLYTLQFIMPGLHQHEKRAILPALAIGFGLFLCGVLFAYLWVLPSVLEFFYSYGESMGIANEWRIGYYLSFATQFTLIFGLCFELPVIVWVLVKIGLLNYEVMSRTRGYAVVAIVVLAAVITPTPDAFTLALLALPMVVLYELSIWLAWFDARRQKKKELQEEEERLARLLANPPAPVTEPAPEDPEQEYAASLDHDLTEEDEEMDRGDDAGHKEKSE